MFYCFPYTFDKSYYKLQPFEGLSLEFRFAFSLFELCFSAPIAYEKILDSSRGLS